MSTVIRVEHLSKQYRLGMIGGATLREDVSRWWALKRGKDDPLAKVGAGGQKGRIGERFWALKDVSFEVKQGEILGIIGRNGAGKSTLLKILSRITAPTDGVVKVKGRIGSLLEVGTGFHPELTGRENIYLNGAILGMNRREVTAKLDEIIAFSEVEQFIDTPVKRYSSGMYVRLAFAVAAHLDPEILIVDEVLAVGDAAFQKKCLGKMGEVAGEGRTVLFVSHNMASVSGLTTRCALICGGWLERVGDTADAIHAYFRTFSNPVARADFAGTGTEPRVASVEVLTSEPANIQAHGAPMTIKVRLYCPAPVDGARLAVRVHNNLNQPTMYLWAYDSAQPMCRSAGLHVVQFDIDKVRLCAGQYTLGLSFAERFGGRIFAAPHDLCAFSVEMLGQVREGGWPSTDGAYIDDYRWHVEVHADENALPSSLARGAVRREARHA